MLLFYALYITLSTHTNTLTVIMHTLIYICIQYYQCIIPYLMHYASIYYYLYLIRYNRLYIKHPPIRPVALYSYQSVCISIIQRKINYLLCGEMLLISLCNAILILIGSPELLGYYPVPSCRR